MAGALTALVVLVTLSLGITDRFQRSLIHVSAVTVVEPRSQSGNPHESCVF
jgi:hypothetical protein